MSIVIFDNLSSHKVAGIEELIHRAGATVEYLPQYSPDFNPREMMCSKVKNYLRKVSKTEIDELIDAAGAGLRSVTPNDAVGWYKHCGYYS